MARSRNIKPGFFKNELLAEIQPLGRILFEGLWCLADREGRLEDRPKRIKAEILPYDNCDIDQLLDELASKEFIIRYEVNGEKYIQVVTFKKHQNPHIREAASTIPEPSNNEHHESTVLSPDKNGTSPADSFNLIPDSLNSDSLNPISNNSSSEPNGPTPNKSTKVSKKDLVFQEDSVQFKLGLFIRDLIISVLPTAKVPEPTPQGLKGWCKDIDLMIRIDNRKPQEIADLFKWAQSDSFWCANIRSPGKLRAKWDTLELQSKNRQPNRDGPGQTMSKNAAKALELAQKYADEEGQAQGGNDIWESPK